MLSPPTRKPSSHSRLTKRCSVSSEPFPEEPCPTHTVLNRPHSCRYRPTGDGPKGTGSSHTRPAPQGACWPWPSALSGRGGCLMQVLCSLGSPPPSAWRVPHVCWYFQRHIPSECNCK